MAQRKINILLLGETGVGKTTFINMLPYYLSNKTLSEIASEELVVLAPISFTHINENFEETNINLGNDPNEVATLGASSTQRPKSYLYGLPLRNAILNVIDTPGIGDTRGIKRDQQNTEVLLRYISELEYLDAVCILLKPDDSRFSVLFEHCMRVMLKQLVGNVRNNLVFVFTRTRGYHYTPGHTYTPLKKTIEDVQRDTNSIIPFGKTNVFCIDNEAFRFLAAKKKGVNFQENEVQRYTESFDHSSAIVKRMIDYITTLTPAPMQNVATPNESKRVILRLFKPLTSLLTNYEKALVKMKEYENTLNSNVTNLDMLKQNLFKIEHQRIVKEHISHEYQRSQSGGISLSVSFKPFIPSLGGNYNYSDNVHETKTQNVDFVEQKTFDKDVYKMIVDENSARVAVQTKIAEMNGLCDEYKKEMGVILGAVAMFYVYSNENNMATDYDPFVKTLQSALDEARLDDNEVLAKEFDTMIKRYEIKKSGFYDVQPEDIKEMIQELFSLNHSGKTFKKIMDAKFIFDTKQLTI